MHFVIIFSFFFLVITKKTRSNHLSDGGRHKRQILVSEREPYSAIC